LFVHVKKNCLAFFLFFLARNVAASISKFGNVFEYNFNHSLSFDAWGPGGLRRLPGFILCLDFQFCDPYACHGAELPFVFHTPLANFDPEEKQLSIDMVTYWANFARNGDPSQGMSVTVPWPSYNPNSNSNIEFSTPSTQVQVGYRNTFCNFWDNLGYAF
jgi:carboxylesterase type B